MVQNAARFRPSKGPRSRGEYEEYHPYGSTAWWAEKSGIQVSRKRYRYTGMERDEETGMAYHSARYYLPWLGRWASADPAGLVDGGNRFAYVGGRVVGLRDRTGHQAESPSLSQRASVASGAIYNFWADKAATAGKAVQAVPIVVAAKTAMDEGLEAGARAGVQQGKALTVGLVKGAVESAPIVVVAKTTGEKGLQAGVAAGAKKAYDQSMYAPLVNAAGFAPRTVQNAEFLLSGNEALAKEAVENQVGGAMDVVETVATTIGTVQAARVLGGTASRAVGELPGGVAGDISAITKSLDATGRLPAEYSRRGHVQGGKIFKDKGDDLPDPVGVWREADVGDIRVGEGGSRGSQRIVYDDAGNVHYTPDHYESWVPIRTGRE